MSQESNITISLRSCQLSDLSDILSIEQSSFNHPYNKATFNNFLAINPNRFIISEEKGQVCGYIIFASHGRRGLIVSLAVSPRFRRRGHGRLLIQHALKEIQKYVDLVELQVSTNNKTAVEFYEKQGFKQIAYIKEYYTDGEDALVMVMKIR